MELLKEELLFKRVEDILNLKAKTDEQAKDCQGYDLARRLSMEYWALMDSLEICILSCGMLVKDNNHQSDIMYSGISNSKESSAAGKKQAADNDINYLNSVNETKKFELYLNYLKNIRENLSNGYDMMKLIYKNEITVLQMAPKI